MAGSSPQGPWVPLTSGPERPRHRNPRPPSPPATHTWPTFAGDNRDSHPNWWKQARKAGSGPPGPGSHIGRQRDRGPRRPGPLGPPRGPGLPRAPTEPCAPLVRICGRSPEAAGAVFHATEQENAPARRGSARFAGPLGPLRLCSSLRGTCRCPADSTDLAAGAARPPVGQRLPLAPARGTAAPRAARPLFHAPSSRLTRRSWPGSIGFI